MSSTEILDLTEGLATVKEAAAFLSISTRSVQRLIADRKLPSLKIRGARRIPRRALRDLLAASIDWR